MLLSIDAYRSLTEAGGSVVDQLAMRPDDGVDFDAPRTAFRLRGVDLG